jgi:uncharacterized NAD(P)/FAD-binding protein YdhS
MRLEMRGARRIVIVGGGFSGSSAAVQFVRRSSAPLEITVVEPRARVGGGLAYSSDEPDHRLNGQPGSHNIDPMEEGLFTRWCETQEVLIADPGARLPNDTTFMRRAVFRRFLEEIVAEHAAWPTGSSIRHVRDRVIDVVPGEDSLTVITVDNPRLDCDLVVLAAGHTRARLAAIFKRELSRHARVIVDPLSSPRLPEVPPTDRVLVLGSGLTAYDIISSLITAGHLGPIDVVSRKGLRPRRQQPRRPGETPLPWLGRVAGPPAPFILGAGNPPTARAPLRALRQRIREVEQAGQTWDQPFVQLRDMVSHFWPACWSLKSVIFFTPFAHVYDVHRFRVAPQNQTIVEEGQKRGQVRFRAASLARIDTDDDQAPIRIALRGRGTDAIQDLVYDRVINCSGVDSTHPTDVPLYATLLARDMICIDPSGIGLSVDAHSRALARDGSATQRLRIVGPPTTGARGDPLGSPYIAIQIHRMIPDIAAVLGVAV